MLNIIEILSKIEDCSYCIVKMSELFPLYRQGDDIDIFCYSVDEIVKRLIAIGKDYVDAGYKIHVKSIHNKKHVHVDFINSNEIDVRFDIYGALPVYDKLMIKPAFFESVIENSQSIKYSSNSCSTIIKIPSIIDEMLICYFEFAQWYDVRPDKLKHLNYVTDSLQESNKSKFFEKLHHYTSLPNTYYQEKNESSKLSRLSGLVKRIFK